MHHSYASKTLLRSLSALTLGLGLVTAAQAQTVTPIAIAATPYTQNFDAMGTAGTAFPAGWAAIRFAGTGTANDPLPLTVVTATSNAGAAYNVGPLAGTAGDTDRALGSLASGSTVPALGAAFTNSTGAAVTRVTISGRSEQWRTGSDPAQLESLMFEYSLDATSLSTGTWTAVPALDIRELQVASTTAGPLDGNAAANSVAITAPITLNWPSNTTMWIRWKDTNDIGSDGLLAIDDFRLTTGVTAVREAAFGKSVSLFPNPATNKLTIRVGADGRGAAVEVFNSLGQRVQGTTAASEEVSLDVANLATGIYSVRMTTKDGVVTRSFLKQ
ncbi:T9SS type A sorting domain-containing protein [Hymenobacter sp. BT175]|uniref:T9SS type A sorting domain-containing protein n=1 Tax=Hymenobacter translucens TaxID=2886507 RepID=UPI001D0F2CD8|nr:T9SS type A sorting domain-containing protein [Hymenobacter translucens]MCC2547814.1 T9SS type A sorting domain-containing protein [Hymenobacter translucens]